MRGIENLQKNEIYIISDNKMYFYPVRVEKDIETKLNIGIMFTAGSNAMFNMSFSLFDIQDFKNCRRIKKYFLDNIPHVINVFFGDNSFTVQLTRKQGLDVLNINETLY